MLYTQMLGLRMLCVILSQTWRPVTVEGLQHNPVLHSERPKLYTILAFLSAVGLKESQKNFHSLRASLPSDTACEWIV